jgi:hypothetical protein
MIKKLFRIPNNSNNNFRLIIERKNNPIYILYKHKYISLTSYNNIKLVHGNIYGFSIGKHTYIDNNYSKSKKSKTVMSSSIYMNHICNKEYMIPKYINIPYTMSSLYICGDDLYLDPSMQLLDLFNLYIDYKINKKLLPGTTLLSTINYIKKYREELINELYNNIPTNDVPFYVNIIEQIEEN